MTHHVLESITDLSTSLMKAGGMASSEKDAGFCSGGDEDDMSGFHSPSASEDSVEVQITPISLKNKRKLAEPRKVQEPSTAPLKKRRFERIEVEIARDEEPARTVRSPSPFRPWSCSNKSIDSKLSSSSSTSSASSSIATEGNIVERADMFCPLGDASLPVTSIATKKRVNQAEDSDHVPEDDHDRRRESEDTEARGNVEESRRTRKESQSRQHLPPRLRYATQTRPPRIEKRENPRQKFEAAKVSGPVSTIIAKTTPSTSTTSVIQSATTHQRLQEEPLSLVLRGDVASRVPSHPAVNGSYEKPCAYPVERPNVSSASLSTSLLSSSSSSSLSSLSSLSSSSSSSSSSCSSSSSSLLSFHRPPNHRTDTSSSSGIGGGGGGGGSGGGGSGSGSSNGTSFSTAMSTTATITTTTANTTTAATNVQTGHPRQQHQQPVAGQQRNYKNMTRERRIEANARERTRVHTISAAFDTLRRAIPAYSHNQKLSKLSVLRIACSYIMTLGKIVNAGDENETANGGGASLRACVDLVSRTIQTEGKLRKRKED